MSGSDMTTPPPSPKMPGPVPADYSSMLEQAADKLQIARGPGGTIDVQEKGAEGIAPSQEGVGGTLGKLQIKTNDPKLDEPSFAGLGLWSLTLANQLLHVTLGLPLLSGEELAGTRKESSLSEELAFVSAAYEELEQEGFEGPGPLKSKTHTEAKTSVFEEWLSEFSIDVPPTTTTLGQQKTTQLKTITSTDPDAVEQLLSELADLDSLGIDETRLGKVREHLTSLANSIAASNQTGGSIALRLTLPELVTFVLAGTIDNFKALPQLEQDDTMLALLNVGKGLSSLNLESLVNAEEPSQEYTDLVSENPEQVATLLASLLNIIGRPDNITDEMISQLSSAIAETTGVEGNGVASADITTVNRALKTIVGSLPEQTTQALSLVLPALAQEIAGINETKLLQGTKSTDPITVEESLTKLIGTSEGDPELSAAENKVVGDYLKALTIALSFMAQTRSLIVQMEGEFSQKLSDAKLTTIADQVKYAGDLYTEQLDKISTNYEATVSGIKKARLMKVLMPLIGIGVAIISIAAIVGSIVATVVTAGGASPTIIAAAGLTSVMVKLLVALAVSVTVLAITIADAACSWATGTSMWEMLAEKLGTDDPILKAVISMSFEVLAMIVVGICTFGAGFGAGAVKLSAKAVTVGADVAVDAALAASKAASQAAIAAGKTAAEAAKAAAKAAAQAAKAATDAATKGGKIAAQSAGELISKGASIISKEGGEVTLKLTFRQASKALFEEMFTAITKESIKKSLSSTAGLSMTTLVVGTVISGITPALAMGITKALEALGVDEEKAAIYAMIIIIILTLIATLAIAGPRGIGKGVKSAAKGAATFAKGAATSAKSAVSSVKNSLAAALNKIKTFLKETTSITKDSSLSEILKGIFGILPKLASRIGKNILGSIKNSTLGFARLSKSEKFDKLCLEITKLVMNVTDGLRLATSITKIKTADVQRRLKLQLADIEEAIAELEGVMQLFSQLEGVDQTETLEAITATARENSENWAKLVRMVSSFTKDASSRIGELTARA